MLVANTLHKHEDEGGKLMTWLRCNFRRQADWIYRGRGTHVRSWVR